MKDTTDPTVLYDEILAIIHDPGVRLSPEFIDKLIASLDAVDRSPNQTLSAHFMGDLGSEPEAIDSITNPDLPCLSATSPNIDKVSVVARQPRGRWVDDILSASLNGCDFGY